MIDPARLMLLAAALSGSALAAFAWRVTRADPATPDRLIGELRVAQWAAVLLAAVSALALGLALPVDGPTLGLSVALDVGLIVLAGVVVQSEPRGGLLFATMGFAGHAAILLANRPGWIWPSALPRWFIIGCVAYDVVVGAVCYWTRRN